MAHLTDAEIQRFKAFEEAISALDPLLERFAGGLSTIVTKKSIRTPSRLVKVLGSDGLMRHVSIIPDGKEPSMYFYTVVGGVSQTGDEATWLGGYDVEGFRPAEFTPERVEPVLMRIWNSLLRVDFDMLRRTGARLPHRIV